MRLRNRLRRLERARLPATADPGDWLTEEQWLAEYEAWGREGFFAAEPDFPVALAEYRLAIERARAQTDPPFDPPADFMPNLADLPHLRLLNWRTEFRFPDVHAGWTWLAAMFGRVHDGTPPLS